MTIPETVIDRIVRLLAEAIPDLLAIYRFGSWGTDREWSGSDVDLAILPSGPVPPEQVWLVGQSLAEELERDVDLVDLLRASTVMRAQVIHGGERLWCRDPSPCASFEDRVYSEYALLNEERAGILLDIASRGTVYAR